MFDLVMGVGFGIEVFKGIMGGRKGYKVVFFEGGIGVLFIVCWLGKIKVGSIDSVFLLLVVDLLFIFCDIVGVKLLEFYMLDGIS